MLGDISNDNNTALVLSMLVLLVAVISIQALLIRGLNRLLRRPSRDPIIEERPGTVV